MILSPGGTLVLDGLPRTRPGTGTEAAVTTPREEPDLTGWRTLDEVERDHILAVCERCGWRINGKGNAADRLGINPNTLRSRMQRLGILRPTGGRPG